MDTRMDTAQLDRQEVEQLFAPTGTAVGLPGRAYYDEEFYERERHTVFSKGWVGVGFASDIPEPGDVKPISIAGWEIILVRNKSGEINVFHNLCRHRGMRLVKDAGNIRNIRCFYHCWTYNL